MKAPVGTPTGGAYVPKPGGIPAPAAGPYRVRGQRNPIKRFNNWNVCFSCGLDVPAWHNSQTCMWKKPGHRDEVTRANAQAYKDAGHDVCMTKSHKTQLPTNPQPGYK